MASTTPPTMAKSPADYKATIGIDIGTRYSGYAYQLNGSSIVEVCSRWGEDAAVGLAYKAPTHVLLEENGTFIAFGEDANNFYFEEGDKTHLFFENFKMILYDDSKEEERILDAQNVKITAANGNQHPALEVFAAAIEYLKDHALGLIKETADFVLTNKDVLWVLTTPAIWDISAKFFMRQAAYQAGLIDQEEPDRLIIALEPECAALYCRTLPVAKFMTDADMEGKPKDAKAFDEMKPGSTYVVIDAGGGTLDMTALQVGEGKGVKELVQASGGAHGGAEVDKLFVAMLKDIFSRDFVKKFQKGNPIAFQRVLQEFEYRKRQYLPSGKRPRIAVQLPHEFHVDYQKFSGETVLTAVGNYRARTKNSVELKNELLIQRPFLDKLFKPVVDRIQEEVLRFLDQPEVEDASVFFLVGGFAPFLSTHLRPPIKERFPRAKIPVPMDAGVAVLKGAVIFGQDTSVVQERVARQTYGIAVGEEFQEDIHRDKLKYYDKDTETYRCHDVFSPIVMKGETIKNGEVRIAKRLQVILTGCSVKICSTTTVPVAGEPQYTCDEEFLELGSVWIPPVQRTAAGEIPTIGVQFRVGGTELQVTILNKDTNESFYTEVVFSSN